MGNVLVDAWEKGKKTNAIGANSTDKVLSQENGKKRGVGGGDA